MPRAFYITSKQRCIQTGLQPTTTATRLSAERQIEPNLDFLDQITNEFCSPFDPICLQYPWLFGQFSTDFGDDPNEYYGEDKISCPLPSSSSTSSSPTTTATPEPSPFRTGRSPAKRSGMLRQWRKTRRRTHAKCRRGLLQGHRE